jgi:hypothetical protein
LGAETKVHDGSQQRLRHRLRLINRAIRQQHAEFISTQTGQHIILAHSGLEQSRKLAQEFVAGGMSASVVDHLELIQIEVQHGVEFPQHLGFVQHTVCCVLELAPIGESR